MPSISRYPDVKVSSTLFFENIGSKSEAVVELNIYCILVDSQAALSDKESFLQDLTVGIPLQFAVRVHLPFVDIEHHRHLPLVLLKGYTPI